MRIKWNRKNLILGFMSVFSIGLIGFFIVQYFNQPSQPQSSIENGTNNKPALTGSDGNVATPVDPDSDFLTLPEGFTINKFAQDLGKVRVMAFDNKGVLYASVTDLGRIVSFPDNDKDGVVDLTKVVLSGLNKPHGLLIRCIETCEMYVAETDKVSIYEFNPDTQTATNPRKIIDLPPDSMHFTRSIQLAEIDGIEKLLISVGSSCNVCVESDDRRAKVLISNLDGSNLREFSTGLRNAVFMVQNPVDEKIYVTEMGRDFLGDNVPPEEINVLEDGGFYGWPFCYDDNTVDTSFSNTPQAQERCASAIPPLVKMQAHSAPLGLRFLQDEWGNDYAGSLFVAYHGSWNRTEPTGYKIVRMYTKDGQIVQEDFITGWLNERTQVLGRPVDIIFSSNAEMYITDDKEGIVYRIVRL